MQCDKYTLIILKTEKYRESWNLYYVVHPNKALFQTQFMESTNETYTKEKADNDQTTLRLQTV